MLGLPKVWIDLDWIVKIGHNDFFVQVELLWRCLSSVRNYETIVSNFFLAELQETSKVCSIKLLNFSFSTSYYYIILFFGGNLIDSAFDTGDM
jgi:hypothetical protein